MTDSARDPACNFEGEPNLRWWAATGISARSLPQRFPNAWPQVFSFGIASDCFLQKSHCRKILKHLSFLLSIGFGRPQNLSRFDMCSDLVLSSCGKAILSWLEHHWLLGVFLLFWSGWRIFVAGMLSGPDSAKRLSNWLRFDSFSRAYQASLSYLLILLDELLKDNKNHNRQIQNCWSSILFDRCLVIAVAYPLCILFSVWAYFGVEIRFSGEAVLYKDVPPFIRGVSTFSFFILIIFAILSAFKSELLEKFKMLGISVFGVMALVISDVLQVAGAVTSALIGAFVGILALSVMISGARVISKPGPGARVAMVAVVGAASGALGAEGLNLWVGALAAVWVLLIAAIIGYVISRDASALVTYGLLMIALSVSLLIPAVFASPLERYGAGVILFLAILPLMNAIFDYISIGLTRWTLHHAVDSGARRIIVWSIADIAGALIIFFALKATTLILIVSLNIASSGGASSGLIDVPSFLVDIQNHRSDFWWLYIPFLTTLIPTVIHLVAALFSLVIWLPRRLALRWSKLSIRSGDWLYQQEVKWGVSLWLAAVTTPPAILILAAGRYYEYYSEDLSIYILYFVRFVLTQSGAN